MKFCKRGEQIMKYYSRSTGHLVDRILKVRSNPKNSKALYQFIKLGSQKKPLSQLHFWIAVYIFYKRVGPDYLEFFKKGPGPYKAEPDYPIKTRQDVDFILNNVFIFGIKAYINYYYSLYLKNRGKKHLKLHFVEVIKTVNEKDQK